MKKTNWYNAFFIGVILTLLITGCNKENSAPINEKKDSTNSEITIPASKGEIVKHTYYTLSYNEFYEQAEWVYYKLTSNMVSGTQERTDDFRVDSAVSTGSADLSDFAGSGYDRGHLCPAGDMKISYLSMSESFYLSNMSPQEASFNRGIWETLESTVRNVAKAEKEIYVVTGPVFKNNKGTIGANKVAVPGYFYKIIYAPANEKMLGFVLPNEKGTKEIADYAVTVDSVENITAIDFFPQLATNLENNLEGKIELNKWSLVPLAITDNDIDPEPQPESTNCPATANCGCSEKNKSDCSADSCCQWIVGTGCKCR